MRACWNRDDFKSADRGQLRFIPEQAALMRDAARYAGDGVRRLSTANSRGPRSDCVLRPASTTSKIVRYRRLLNTSATAALAISSISTIVVSAVNVQSRSRRVTARSRR